MSESVTLCPECHSVNKLDRIPQIQSIVRKNNVGDLVEKAIEENRELLTSEKRKRMKPKER